VPSLPPAISTPMALPPPAMPAVMPAPSIPAAPPSLPVAAPSLPVPAPSLPVPTIAPLPTPAVPTPPVIQAETTNKKRADGYQRWPNGLVTEGERPHGADRFTVYAFQPDVNDDNKIIQVSQFDEALRIKAAQSGFNIYQAPPATPQPAPQPAPQPVLTAPPALPTPVTSSSVLAAPPPL
jgi:hypothetical protein